MLVFVLCGLWHGAAWHWLVYGFYNGMLMSLHRVFDRSFPDAAWRGTVLWNCLAWISTFYQLLLGLILIRMTNWQTGGLLLRSMLGLPHEAVPSAEPAAFVPIFAGAPAVLPLLLLLGLAGHFASLLKPKWSEQFTGVVEVSRGLGYAAALVLVVALSPGVTKSFIYIAF